MKTNRVVVAQLGARMHYAVPQLFQAAGLLELLYTDICAVKGWPSFLRLLPPRVLPQGVRRLQGRIPVGIPSGRITAFTQFGYEYASKRRSARSASEMTAVHLWAGDRFNELILNRGFGKATMVYGFNSASAGILEAARELGMTGIVEQTIAPRSTEMTLLHEEAELFSEWSTEAVDSNADVFIARERHEWDLADKIIVASKFVKKAIAEAGGPVDKCIVVPYGVDQSRFSVTKETGYTAQQSRTLRVLFVGGVGLRKGVQYLLEAFRQLKNCPIQCRIVGGLQVGQSVLQKVLPEHVEILGPVARSAIRKEYAKADVFCLPSLCEGSATVVYEALAAGLPVVTTVNTGSIVRDGIEGYIVPIRDADAIAERLEQLASDSMLLEAMSKAALARSSYGSLEAYGNRLLKSLQFDKTS